MGLALTFAAITAGIALVFNFTNGFNDSASQVATVIVSRALRPPLALLLAALGNFVGAYFLGTAVAETIGKGIIDPRAISNAGAGTLVIIAALGGAIIWNVITWYFGLPSSSSHALVGGLVGAFVAAWGMAPIHWLNVGAIILVMILSPVIGFAVTYITANLTIMFSQWSSPKINRVFKRLQILSLTGQSLAHGANDAQKAMGVITFALIILGFHHPMPADVFAIPKWVIIASSISMALGTMLGGQRIIKKIGTGLYKIRPIHGFASQTTSSLIIYFTAVLGFPVSTTQVISSSILGAGAAFRPKMIRWLVAQDMFVVWLITIPASAALAGLTFLILNGIVPH